MSALLDPKPKTNPIQDGEPIADIPLEVKLYQRLRSCAEYGLLTPQSVFRLGLETLTSSTPGDITYENLALQGWDTESEAFQTVRGFILRRDDPEISEMFSLGWNMFFGVAVEKPYDTPRIIADRRKAELEQLCFSTALFLVPSTTLKILPKNIDRRLEDAVQHNIPASDVAYVVVHNSIHAIAEAAFRGTNVNVISVSENALPKVPTYTKDKTVLVPSYQIAVELILSDTKQEFFGHIVRLPYEG